MSKKRRRKRKIATKAVLPKKKAEVVEQPETFVFETRTAPEPKEPEPATPEPKLNLKTQMETILKEAPMLPWEIDIAYIDIDFRKAYVTLLKKLVKLHELPYNVNQVGKLSPK